MSRDEIVKAAERLYPVADRFSPLTAVVVVQENRPNKCPLEHKVFLMLHEVGDYFGWTVSNVHQMTQHISELDPNYPKKIPNARL